MTEPNPAPPADPAQTVRSRWAPAVAAGLAVALALLAHGATLGYALIGFDTYLQVATARIQSWSDFTGTFTEKLTDGRIDADFYRPVQNLSIALDFALFGTTPRGYQADSLLTLALTVLAVFLAARKLLGGRALVGPFVAATLFGLHPVLLHVVPMACRRSEMLTVLFLCLLLLVLPGHAARRPWPRLAAAAALALLACGSKELGTMAFGLVFLHQLVCRYDRLLPSVGRALLASLPTLAACLLYVGVRTAVLDGIGGYQKAPPFAWETYTRQTLDFGGQALADIFAPGVAGTSPDGQRGWLGPTLAALWLPGVLVTVVVAGRGTRGRACPPAGCGLLAVAWLIPTALLVGLPVRFGPWYTTLPLAGVALGTAAIVELAVAAWRRPRSWTLVVPAMIAQAGWAGMAVLAVSSSPLVRSYPELGQASAIVARAVTAVDAAADEAARSGRVLMLDVPPIVDPLEPTGGRLLLGRVATVQPRGLEAYCETRHPAVKVQARYVAGIVRTPPSPPPGQLLLLLKHYRVNQ